MVPTNALPAKREEACHAALFSAWPASAPWRHVVRVTPVLRLSAHSTWALCGLLPVRPPCSYCCNRRFVRVLGSCHRALVSGAALCISARRVGLSLLMAATVECGHSLKVVVRRSDVARSGHVVVLACGVALGVGHDVLLVNCINSGGSQLVSELRIQGCARLSLPSVRWGTLPHSSDHSRQAGICFQFGPCCAISNRVLPSATGMDALAREINGRPCATELASIQTASTAHARSGPGPIERSVFRRTDDSNRCGYRAGCSTPGDGHAMDFSKLGVGLVLCCVHRNALVWARRPRRAWARLWVRPGRR